MDDTRRLSRRRAIRLAAAQAAMLSVAGCSRRRPLLIPLAHAPSALDPPRHGAGSLRAHAEAAGLFFGCALGERRLANDAGYADLIRSQTGIICPDTALEWDALRPAPEVFRFEAADAVVAFAEANSIRLRGRTLCPTRGLPDWFTAYATPGNARDLLLRHVARVAGRYAGRMHCWDVVADAVEPGDGRPDGLHDAAWLRFVGPDFPEVAFRAAREADPQALLALSQSGLEGEDPDSAARRIAVLLLLRRLRARRVPVDALALRSHVRAGQSCGAGLVNLLAAVRELGLQVFLTEIEVEGQGSPADVAPQGESHTLAEYLRLTLPDAAVHVVMMAGTQGWNVPGHEERPEEEFFVLRNAFETRHAGQGRRTV